MGKRLVVIDYDSCVGCGLCMLACSRRFGIIGFSKSAIRVKSIGGIEKGFVVVVCRACTDPPCMRVCPVEAISKRDVGVLVNYSKCIGCGFCVKACDVGAVQWDEEANKPIICIHCGYCIQFCPHGVLTFEEVKT